MGEFSSVAYRGRPPMLLCCEPKLRALANGDWVVAFLTGTDAEPAQGNFHALIRSADQGRTWSEPREIYRNAGQENCAGELIVNGDNLLFLSCVHDGNFHDWRCIWQISNDHGHTWSEAQPFTPLPERGMFLATYRASWGEWLTPFEYFPSEDPEELPNGRMGRRPYNGVLISGDKGKSWQQSGLTGPNFSWAENNVVELSDGRLVMLIRYDRTGVIYRSDSLDRGRTWGPSEPTDIPNGSSKFRLFRLSDGRILLLNNPNRKVLKYKRLIDARTPLALWLSDDDMHSWSYRRVLTDFPGWLAYPDGFVSDDERYLHFVFDYNRHDIILWSAEIPH